MAKNSMEYQFNCTSPSSFDELKFIVEHGVEVKISTFKKLVNRVDFQTLMIALGYGKSFPAWRDSYLRFFTSKRSTGGHAGYVQHSAIEYIFY